MQGTQACFSGLMIFFSPLKGIIICALKRKCGKWLEEISPFWDLVMQPEGKLNLDYR